MKLDRPKPSTHVSVKLAALCAASLLSTGAVNTMAQLQVVRGLPITNDGGVPNTSFFFSGSGSAINDSGTAVGGLHYRYFGFPIWSNAQRWNIAGFGLEMGNHIDYVQIEAIGINNAGQSIGGYQSLNFTVEHRAVRWDSNGTRIELANLGLRPSFGNSQYTFARDINASGTIVGRSSKVAAGQELGERAVRWDSLGNIVELGNLGTSVDGVTQSDAHEINNAGQVAGGAQRYVSGVQGSYQAVRWNTSGTPTQLPGLAANSSANAFLINASGDTAGLSSNAAGRIRPVRWDSSGTVTELSNLGVDPFGSVGIDSVFSGFRMVAMNDSGLVAGNLEKYANGGYRGQRAVRWATDGSALELPGLTQASTTRIADLNNLGMGVGTSSNSDTRAVYWAPDGTVTDLNTLISPTSGWFLSSADDISDTGWIVGTGSFDPDGPGGADAFSRAYSLQIVIPEPTSLTALAGAALMTLRRRS